MPGLAHISDLHFGREIPAVVTSLLKALETLRPNCVVISGDLTQRATPKEFHAAHTFLQQLPWPCIVVPGNHDLPGADLWTRFHHPWRRWRRYLNLPLEPVHHATGASIVGVNTARRFDYSLDWSRGRIDRRQRAHVSTQFAATPADTLRVVVAHHPFWLPQEQTRRGLIGGRDAALSHFAQTGVDLVLSGHVHLAYAQVLSGVVISHAGTTTSNRLLAAHPNSFNLIQGDRQHVGITQFNWRDDAFVAMEPQHFVRTSQGWTHD